METEQMETERVRVYVDGLNFYYGIKHIKPCVKWLDFQSLAESFMEEQMVLERVTLFTAELKGIEWLIDSDTSRRQTNYLHALKAHCTKLDIVYGDFLPKQLLCPKCGKKHTVPEEKCTDVNIASYMLRDAYKDKFDVAYLISGDSDLATPVEMVKEEKHVVVALPPNRHSHYLASKANKYSCINKRRLSKHLLPAEVTRDGETFACPPEWK